MLARYTIRVSLKRTKPDYIRIDFFGLSHWYSSTNFGYLLALNELSDSLAGRLASEFRNLQDSKYHKWEVLFGKHRRLPRPMEGASLATQVQLPP
jgi:hypothetical protein